MSRGNNQSPPSLYKSSYAGPRDYRRSTTGFAIYMVTNLLSWGAMKQAVVAHSTAEAEYHSLASTTAELMSFMHLLKNLGYSLPSPMQHTNNNNALSMAKNPVFHHCTKHIEIDVHFIWKQVDLGLIQLAHVFGREQVADIFTKSLCGPKFAPNRSKLCVSPIPPWAWGGKKRQTPYTMLAILHCYLLSMILALCTTHAYARIDGSSCVHSIYISYTAQAHNIAVQ